MDSQPVDRNYTFLVFITELCVAFLNACKNLENLKVLSAVFFHRHNQNVSSHPETLQSAYGRWETRA